MVKTPPDSAQEDKDLEEIFDRLFEMAMFGEETVSDC